MQQELPKNRIPVSVSIPFVELAKIDKTATSLKLSRSDFILQATREKMARLKVKNEK